VEQSHKMVSFNNSFSLEPMNGYYFIIKRCETATKALRKWI